MNLNDWKLKGSISIWRYEPLKKNFPGWHMTATHDGYDSILSLIELLEASPFGSKRTIELVAPDAWSASSELKKTAEQKVIIYLVESDSHWLLESIDGKLHLKLGLSSLSCFRKGILDARNGKYDFSVGGTKGQNLWFW